MSDPQSLIPKIVGAFLVGALGSLAYITALYFRFIGGTNKERDIVLSPFKKGGGSTLSFWKCVGYCFIGGCIAIVFQFDVPNFVAVQGLILGATWPAVVSQFLSGRMVAVSQDEIDEVNKLEKQGKSMKEFQSALKSIKRIKKV